MSRDRDFRRPQRRGFDDDKYSPPVNFGYASHENSSRFQATPSAPIVRATVKWYHPEKGFGFVQIGGGGDAFLHVRVVERSGNSTVPPGATLEVRVGSGQKGMQVTEVLSVDTSTATPEPTRRLRSERSDAPPDQTAIEAVGTGTTLKKASGSSFATAAEIFSCMSRR